MTLRPALLAALLALAAAGTVDLFGPDGQRVEIIREGPGSRVGVFDQDSRRIGWGRRNPDGSVEVFGTKGNRFGTLRPDRGTFRLEEKRGR